jgi:ribosomal protein S18 acetylase RimI-like enzyme
MTNNEAAAAPRISIERATSTDARTLSELGTATFMVAFGHLYRREDLDTFLAQAHSEARYSTILANPNTAVWLARDTSGQALAYAVAGRCGLPVPDLEPDAGEIKRLYVRPPGQNSGLGSKLMHTMLDWLAAAGRDPLYVGVWSGNQGAQRFYQRYGFEKVGEYEFPVGRQRDIEFILERPPRRGPLPNNKR